MVSSCSHHAKASLPLTSALLPSETKLDRPSPRAVASARTATPRPPDCEAKPTGPATGALGASVALSETSGSVLITPKQLGPTIRMPWAWASRTS